MVKGYDLKIDPGQVESLGTIQVDIDEFITNRTRFRFDPNCMSFWYPLIRDSIPCPDTEMIVLDPEKDLGILCALIRDGYGEARDTDVAQIEVLSDRLAKRAERLGYPVFLRTGHFSGKHDWKRTCFVTEPNFRPHIRNIVSLGELFGSFEWNVWVVREFLKTDPITILPRYGDMPVTPEVRIFANSNQVTHRQFYWPIEALKQGGSETPEAHFQALRDAWPMRDLREAERYAVECARLCNGSTLGKTEWSVDSMRGTDFGVVVTDMALGAQSYRTENPNWD